MLRWSIALVALFMVSPSAHAHIGDRLFSIFELTDEDLAHIDLKDGTEDDWRDVVGEPSLTALDFFIDPRIGDGPIYDPADLDFQIWLGWHQATNRIYVAMECSDNAYVNQYGGLASNPEIPHNDSMVFMIDGDHNGGQFGFHEPPTGEEVQNVFLAQAQLYFAIAQTPDSRYINMMFYDDWFSSPPYVEAGGGIFGETPTISVIEFYVTPFDRLIRDSQEQSIVSSLVPGKIIGFAVHLTDVDTTPGEFHAGFLLPSVYDSFYTADLFADGVLVGTGVTAPEISAVTWDSWGQIKASFGSH